MLGSQLAAKAHQIQSPGCQIFLGGACPQPPPRGPCFTHCLFHMPQFTISRKVSPSSKISCMKPWLLTLMYWFYNGQSLWPSLYLSDVTSLVTCYFNAHVGLFHPPLNDNDGQNQLLNPACAYAARGKYCLQFANPAKEQNRV